MSTSTTLLTTLCIGALATPAFAQTPAGDNNTTAADDKELPKPHSHTDEAPPVARPDLALPPGGVVSQAGRGGDIGYGRPGVLELGGSAGLMIAPGFRNVNVSPSIGWFVAENFELSAILSVSNISTSDQSATVFSAVVEPSYHLPFNRSVFGFFGLGMGGAYISDLGGGFAVAPRIGVNLLVGRSGILSPSLSYEYTTHNLDVMDKDVALLAVSSALRVNIGYTAMW